MTVEKHNLKVETLSTRSERPRLYVELTVVLQ